MNSSHGLIITWMKWVIYSMSLWLGEPSISKSFFLVPPLPEEFTASVSDHSRICLLFCVGGCGFGDLCARSSLCAPLARLNHGRCFLCGNAEAQTVFETFYFVISFVFFLLFGSVASESVTDWRRNEKWQINTCLQRLCMVVGVLFVLYVLLLWRLLASLFTL